MRGIQYAAAYRSITGVSGILDHPPEPVIGRRYAPTRWRVMTAGFEFQTAKITVIATRWLAMTFGCTSAISRRDASEFCE
jgi:hypothetical protein